MLPEVHRSRVSYRRHRHRPSRGVVDFGGDAGAVVALGDGEVVAGREVEPELRAGAEMAGEAERGVALIARLSFRIDVIRLEGTRNANASRLADMPRAVS
jgi:hypothetical protein